MPTRILMLNSEFPPLGGGTATANRELLENLSGIPNLYIDLITSGVGKNSVEQFADNITIHRVAVTKRNIHHFRNRELLQYMLRAFKTSRNLHRKHAFDLTFIFCVLPSGLIAYYLKKRYGIPYIIRVSGCDIPGFYKRYEHLYPLMTPVMKYIWHRADKIITKCEHERTLLMQSDTRLHICCIPNGINVKKFTAELSALPPDRPLRLLCVARHTKHKGHAVLLQAAKRLIDEGLNIEVDLVGDGQIFNENKLLAAEYGILDRVHFYGAVPREEIAKYYRQAHVFVLPSYNEGMSNAILEAMASGLPILTTQNSSDQLVEHNKNGLISEWGDVDMLTAHVAKLASNKKMMHQMGHVSWQKAQKMEWGHIANNYMALFEEYVA